MFRNMADSLIMHGRIRTTLMRAKELRRVADKLVTLGKDGSLAARRRAVTLLRSEAAVERLFGELAKHFKTRQGGYTRVLHLGGLRPGDNAKMALIEYVDLALTARGKQAVAKDADGNKKKAEKSAGEAPAKEAKAPKKAKAEAKEVKAEAKTAKSEAKTEAKSEGKKKATKKT